MSELNGSSTRIYESRADLELRKDLFVQLQDINKLKRQSNSFKNQRDKYFDQLELQMKENAVLKIELSQAHDELLLVRKDKLILEVDGRTAKGSLSKIRRAMLHISDENAALQAAMDSISLQLYVIYCFFISNFDLGMSLVSQAGNKQKAASRCGPCEKGARCYSASIARVASHRQ